MDEERFGDVSGVRYFRPVTGQSVKSNLLDGGGAVGDARFDRGSSRDPGRKGPLADVRTRLRIPIDLSIHCQANPLGHCA